MAHSGPSKTFFASLQIEASLIGIAGLAFFVRAALKVRPVARQRVGVVVAMTTLILLAGSPTYFAITSVIFNMSLSGDRSLSTNVRPVLVKIVGGPTSQGRDYYVPETITLVIGVNNTIIWQNVDVSHHTVTDLNRLFESGNINPDQSYGYSFNRQGVYSYVCDYHPWMKGTVTVRDKLTSKSEFSIRWGERGISLSLLSSTAVSSSFPSFANQRGDDRRQQRREHQQ